MSPADPPPLPAVQTPPQSGLATFLSLVLLLFLGCAAVSVLDNSFRLFLHRPELALFSGLLLLLTLLTGLLMGGLMAFLPAIPKRYFYPIGLFLPVAYVAVLPLLVYFYRQAQWIEWGVAVAQLLLGLFLLHRARGALSFSWPLFPASQIRDRPFSWGNLTAVVLSGMLLIIPGLVLYTALSAKLAVHHFTDGFVALRTSGLAMQVRKYTRDDGRNVTLVPMVHIGQAKFYHDLAASFPPDAVILMEGVSDQGRLMPEPVNYSRMAAATGGVQQATTFKPKGEIVMADVDISSFSPTTLDLLKNVMLFHSKGLTPETIAALSKPTPPDVTDRLMDDLLARRNRHLLDVLQERLPTSQNIIVPWGAAHMPGISREILKSGFHVVETQEFVAFRF